MSTTLDIQVEGMIQDFKSWRGRHDEKFALLQRQVDAIEINRQRPNTGDGTASDGVGEIIRKFTEHKTDFEKFGQVRFEVPTLLPQIKTTVLSTALVAPMQLPGIEAGARPEYLFRSVLASYPVTTGSVFRVRETGIAGAASPVAEGADKWEITPALTGDTIPVEVVAGYSTCSRQILDDLDGFQAYLRQVLLTRLEAKVEYQLLLGDGSTPNLDSITHNATSFDTSYLPAATDGWEYPDVLHAACTQLIVAGYRPNVIVVSPIDWSKIETLKDSTGRYIIGDPKSTLSRVLWGRQVVESPALDEGVFVVLDSTRFHIRQRMQAVLELSESHDQNFTKNLVTSRIEERLCLVVAQPGAAILGSFSQSPL